ncbi:hypothetical protein HYX10_01260 [Candidatus Woesearchaeota archaeon]|nr:hypothetical protein [Candidatus Woesearchaeota archaeon]
MRCGNADNKRGEQMSLICPNKACKAKKGPCMHEIIFLVVIAAVVVYLFIFR